jgi:hypothetical protein
LEERQESVTYEATRRERELKVLRDEQAAAG